jgi:hypothetical protein
MRLFRLLRAKRQLEQKAVAEAAMVPVRDAREMLYRLLRAGFVALQVPPRLSWRSSRKKPCTLLPKRPAPTTPALPTHIPTEADAPAPIAPGGLKR